MKKSEKEKSDRVADLIANLAVALICGIVGAGLAIGAIFVRGSPAFPSWLFAVAGAFGFILGSAYGLWHAIAGWKRNDAQILDDDEFRFLG